MSAFSDAAFSEQAFDQKAFDFGVGINVSFSLSAFAKDIAFNSSAFSFDTVVASGLRPGRVYKGRYPYLEPRRKPYWEKLDPEEEELLIIAGIDLD